MRVTLAADATRSDAATIDAAVAAARKAFPAWSKTSPAERAAVLRRAAQLYAGHRAELLEVMASETASMNRPGPQTKTSREA